MHDRATADAMAPRDGIVTSAGPRIQQDCRPQRTPFLVASRLADGVQLALFLFGELQGAALPREGHTPLKHNRVKMYSYLENDHLVDYARERKTQKRDGGRGRVDLSDALMISDDRL